MDWTQILIMLFTTLIPTGGIVTIVTLKDKKYDAFLDNVAKMHEQWKEIAAERTTRCAELKADLDRKDEKIDAQYQIISEQREDIDHLRTDNAVLQVLRCDETKCTDRKPPFGSETCVKCETMTNGKGNKRGNIKNQ